MRQLIKKKELIYYKLLNYTSLNLNLVYVRNRLLKQGNKKRQYKNFLNLLFLIKLELNLPFYFLIYRAFLNIIPVLKLLKIKKKRRKDRFQIKRLTFEKGLKVALNWLMISVKFMGQNVSNEFLVSELYKSYFKKSKIYFKKFSEYDECSKSRYNR